MTEIMDNSELTDTIAFRGRVVEIILTSRASHCRLLSFLGDTCCRGQGQSDGEFSFTCLH